jgi:polyhydroxybutyrate depolymerase
MIPVGKTALLWIGLPALALLLLSVACVAGKNPESGSEAGPVSGSGLYTRTISVDGLERYYSFYLPRLYNGKSPMPVVLNFHGGGGNSKTQRHISRMDETADRHGLIVVYPQGTNKESLMRNGYTWNAGSCCGWAQEHGVDDVKFTRMMLDSLEKELAIDPRRIYATGISNGAMMCYRLACEMADRIAAIAPISGPMGMGGCAPARPVSILHFHGTDDQFAPFGGGVGSRSLPGQKFESVKNTISFWQKTLGLQNVTPRTQQLNPSVTEEEYRSDKAELILCTLQGGGHTWPGGQFGFLGKRVLGKMEMTISASEKMWDFFQRHSLP